MRADLLMHGDRIHYTDTDVRTVDHVTTYRAGETQARAVIWFQDGTAWDVPARATVTMAVPSNTVQ